MAEGYYRRYVKLGKIAPENDKDFEKELDAALAAGASHAEIINTLQRVMGETGYSALVRSFYRPESASSTPSPMTVGGTLLVPRSGENVTPEIARHKEMLLEAIRAAEADPFDDAGKIRNPLRYADFLDARKALRDIDITGVEIAKIENDLLAEIGFDWKEWQERMRNERDAKKEVSHEKKASLDSREAGDLEIKLGLALSAAISAAQKAAQKGEDPSDPLDDPKVKDIEERIRQRIDSGDENLDAVIRATENELLMSKRFNLEKSKAQAEAVREGKSKTSLDKIFQQKQEGARAAMERATRDVDDASNEAIRMGRGGGQSMHCATDTVDSDSPEAQRVRDKAANKLAGKLGLSLRVPKSPASPAVTPVTPIAPSPITPDAVPGSEEADHEKFSEEQMHQLRQNIIGVYVEYLRESRVATDESRSMNETVIAAANRLLIEAIKAGMNTDELWQVAAEKLNAEEKIGKAGAAVETPVIEAVELSADLPRSKAELVRRLEDARERLAEIERRVAERGAGTTAEAAERYEDRKSTRLNSSHK